MVAHCVESRSLARPVPGQLLRWLPPPPGSFVSPSFGSLASPGSLFFSPPPFGSLVSPPGSFAPPPLGSFVSPPPFGSLVSPPGSLAPPPLGSFVSPPPLGSLVSPPPGPSRSIASSASVSFGPPPSQCTVRETFEDTAELQAVLTNARGTPGPQSAWEHGMERRMAASETMIVEIHAMVQALRPVPTLLRPEPAVASVSAAFGSAAQMAAASGSGPVQGPSFCQGNARATPWPTSDTVPRTDLFSSLPGPTRAMIDSCTSASLPLDAQIPDGLRAKIWADDYIDLAIMLKPTLLQHQEYSQAMYGGMAHPQGGMSQRAPVGKAAFAITSYERWLQAFNLYMSVYLLLPANVPLAVKMRKYAEIIRGLAEEGGDWWSYDEAFRSLQLLRGWAWDSINWELWLKASQSVRRVGSPIPTGTPFPDKGRARSSYVGPCFSYNWGEQCDRATCYFAHKCQSCGGSGHPAVHCYQAMGKRPLSSSPPVTAPPPRPKAPAPPRRPGPPGRQPAASGSPPWAR